MNFILTFRFYATSILSGIDFKIYSTWIDLNAVLCCIMLPHMWIYVYIIIRLDTPDYI